MKKPGTLYLFPNLLGEHKEHKAFLPESIDRAAETIDGLIAESEKAGRRFLGRFKTKKPSHLITLSLFNKNTPFEDIDFYLKPIVNGENWGLISDCGLPAIADPGAPLVLRARQLGINIVAFPGPSSIYLSLMLSGLPGQRFAFWGYLDKDGAKLRKEIKELERTAAAENMTQIFMERPYQGDQMLAALLETLNDSTLLSLASELTNPGQIVITEKVKVWKKNVLPNLDKKNSIFLIACQESGTKPNIAR